MQKCIKYWMSFCCLVATILVCGQNPEKQDGNWYVPSQIRIQYAGYIGMLSLGAGWQLNHHLELEYSMGLAPKQDAQKTIYTTAAKLIYQPKLDFNLTDKIKIQPLRVALISSYTMGSRFGKYRDNDKYPDGYYWWSTSVRVGLGYQAQALINIAKESEKQLALYLESSLWDLGLFSYYGNSNRSHLEFWDIVILGSGCRLYF